MRSRWLEEAALRRSCVHRSRRRESRNREVFSLAFSGQVLLSKFHLLKLPPKTELPQEKRKIHGSLNWCQGMSRWEWSTEKMPKGILCIPLRSQLPWSQQNLNSGNEKGRLQLLLVPLGGKKSSAFLWRWLLFFPFVVVWGYHSVSYSR